MTPIFHPDFKPRPFWWDAYEPKPLPEIALPKEIRVAIVGAGYAGLSAAIELEREGIDCIVLDSHEPGFGASTRNGGMVSGGVNVGKRYLAKAMSEAESMPFLTDAAEAVSAPLLATDTLMRTLPFESTGTVSMAKRLSPPSIGEAKREETRAQRVATKVAQLAEGKALYWKYESCQRASAGAGPAARRSGRAAW